MALFISSKVKYLDLEISSKILLICFSTKKISLNSQLASTINNPPNSPAFTSTYTDSTRFLSSFKNFTNLLVLPTQRIDANISSPIIF